MTAQPPFVLGHDGESDTVQALESMLEAARRQEIIGIAVTAMYAQRKYVPVVTGECARNPTWTLGMLAVLQRSVEDRVFD